MKMKVCECNKKQTIADFILDNSECGRIEFVKFGWDLDWIVGKQRVPYVKKQGRIQWRVTTDCVLVDDIIQTFGLRADSEIDFHETSSYYAVKEISDTELAAFMKLWKVEYKLWHHNPNTRMVASCLRDFIYQKQVYPKDVFNAIWLEGSYTIEMFMYLFEVDKAQANRLLQAAGYSKKKCDEYYHINRAYKDRIKSCLEHTRIMIWDTRYEYSRKARIKNKISSVIRKIGESIEHLGERFSFQENVLAVWSEPVYGEKHALLNKLSIGIIFLLLLCVSIGVGSIFYQYLLSISHNPLGSSLLSFWGSVFGSMIAGSVTIITTYWIIRRSYKMDYHNERMSVLPVFRITIPKRHFSNYLEEKEQWCEDLESVTPVFEREVHKDMMLLKIENIGSGIAFKTNITGLWGSEDFEMSELAQMAPKYIITPDKVSIRATIQYYDIYGNLYMQTFQSDRFGKLCINGNPPELVMRTKRIRYCQ